MVVVVLPVADVVAGFALFLLPQPASPSAAGANATAKTTAPATSRGESVTGGRMLCRFLTAGAPFAPVCSARMSVRKFTAGMANFAYLPTRSPLG